MTKKTSTSKPAVKKTKKVNFEQKFSFVAGIIAIVFFSLMAISSIFLQKTLREESLDTRRDATVSTVLSAFLSSTPNQTLTINTEETISLKLNTNQIAVSGIQLEFEINGSFSQPPTIKINDQSSSHLQIASQNVRAVRNGEYYAQVILIPTEVASSFSSSSNLPILDIKLTPTQVGSVSFSFNPYESLVTRYNDGHNILSSTPPFIFDVESDVVYCPAPTNLRVDSLSCSNDGRITAVVRWNAIAGVSQYQVGFKRGIDDGEIFTTVNSNSWNMTNFADGRLFLRVRALESNSCTSSFEDEAWQTILFEHNCSTSPECEYGFGEWTSCTDGWQTRTYTANPDTCDAPPDSALRRACSAQCQYSYSDWGTCTNGWQTRTHSVTPNNCHWYETGTLEELTRRCGDQTTNRYLYLYNYESCWHGNSPGNSTYIYWDGARFSNATWIDISPYSDFREFANKNLSGNTERYQQFTLTTGAGFRWNRSGRPAFTFEPNKTYFVRLYNGSHSQVETYYMPQCSGVGGVTYKQCNESCNNNRDCASNLSCHNNACRLVSNLNSSVCAPPADQGLNRSCNEYCADNSECSSGFTCSWNRCRNPLNLNDTECRNLSTSTTNTTYRTLASLPQYETDVSKYCNAYCNYNRDCGANFRCISNQCRLAINPESPTCSVTDTREKGEGNNDTAMADQDSSESADVIAEVTEDDSSAPSDEQYFDDEDKDFSNQTALDALREYLKSKGYSFPQIGMMLLGIILAIILLSFLRKVFSKPKVYQSSAQTKNKLNEDPKKVVANTDQRITLPKKNPLEISNLEHPIYSQKPDQGQELPNEKPEAGANNAMLDRIKNKGIKIPE